MYVRMVLSALVLAAVFMVGSGGPGVAKPVWRKPPPEGVVELVGVAGSGSALVELKMGD